MTSPSELDVLRRRLGIVETLAEEPMHKPDLVEQLDRSRSTVDRAIRELEDAGFVERGPEGFVATQVGQLAAERRRSYLADQRTVLDASALLDDIPPGWNLPAGLLAAVEVETDPARHRVFEQVATAAEAADRLVVALPTLFDSRYLRLWHDRILDGDLAVTLQAPRPELEWIAREFPRLWTELAASPAFVARPGESPPVGFVVAVGGGPGSVRLVGIADDDPTGIAHAADPDAVAWARSRVDALAATEDDVAADVAPERRTENPAEIRDGRLPRGLRAEGFVHVDERHLDRREPMAPATAWRAGLGLPEVAAGYAFDRTLTGLAADGGPATSVERAESESTAGTGSHGDDSAPATAPSEEAVGESAHDADGPPTLTDHLLARLEAGADVALVGPQGSGKSTACKRVATRWRETVGGTVLYRPRGRGRSFESPDELARHLERTDDPALVVVEDAVRAEANAVFEAVDTFLGRDDVVFLLDARESEWRDPEEFPVDARLHAVRREAVETTRMPPLDASDCRHLVDRVAAVTGEAVDVDPEALQDDLVRAADTDRDGSSPGVVSLLFHRLTRYLDPLATDEVTTMDEDVDRLRRDLADGGETALAAGVVVNLLNAAGMAVRPPLVHAVAAGEGPDAHEAVRTALDRLRGEVLFEARDDEHRFRAVHETWSARFLERLLDDRGEAAAREAVGKAVTALLALADDPDRRETVVREVDHGHLERAVVAPTEWADETVTALFAVGRSHPKLAPLFGTAETAAIELPDACSPATAFRCAERRGRMYAAAGDLDRAEGAFEHLASAATARDDDEWLTRSHLGHAEVARRRGETEAAAERARAARDLAEQRDDALAAARARLERGRVANVRGNPDEAESHLERARSTFEELDAGPWTARTLDELGAAAEARADYETATGYYERSLEAHRAVGDRRGEAAALGRLGSLASERGEYGRARERFLLALEVARERGDRATTADMHRRLGDTENERGDFDGAADHYERALAAFEAVDDRHGVAKASRALGTVWSRRSDFDRAADHYERALAAFEAVGDRHGAAKVRQALGTDANRQGDLDAAREQYERALSTLESVGDRHEIAGLKMNLGLVEHSEGNYAAARDRYAQARETFDAVGARHDAARVDGNLGMIALHRGDYERAGDHFDRSASAMEAVGDDRGVAVSVRNLGQVALRRDDHETAAERFERARERQASIGDEHQLVTTYRLLAAVARRRDEYDRAAEHLDEARERVRPADRPDTDAKLRLERGRVALDRGDLDGAASRLEDARETFDASPGDLWTARTRRALARTALARGDEAAAREHLSAALDAFESLGAYGDALRTLELLVAEDVADEPIDAWYERAESLRDEAPETAADEHGGWLDDHRERADD